MAFEAAAPERVTASWGHSSGINIAGIDPKTGEQYVTMILASIISGAGATQQMDGWHACGPLSCFGALSSGDIELLEYQYPILIHKYGLAEDSGGAGKYRGGYGSSFDRDIQAVIKDVKERIISIAAAKIEYGVVLDPETLALNEAETEYLRRQITA